MSYVNAIPEHSALKKIHYTDLPRPYRELFYKMITEGYTVPKLLNTRYQDVVNLGLFVSDEETQLVQLKDNSSIFEIYTLVMGEVEAQRHLTKGSITDWQYTGEGEMYQIVV